MRGRLLGRAGDRSGSPEARRPAYKPADMIPASQPAWVLVRDQVSMNCGRSAGTVENPARPRISAAHIAITIAAEGTAGAELAEFTGCDFRLCADRILFTSSCGKSRKNAAIL